MQALKLGVVRRLLPTSREKREKSGTLRLFEDLPLRHFWQRRFYDFNVWSARKRIEKLRYIHRKSRGPRQARFWLAGVESGQTRAGGDSRSVEVEQLPILRLRGNWACGR